MYGVCSMEAGREVKKKKKEKRRKKELFFTLFA
jgi:hypothetical protein